jgi:signal transduction histidine kinase
VHSATVAAPRASARRLGTTAISVVAGCAVAACAIAIAVIAAGAPADERLSRSILELLMVGAPVAVGLYAARSPYHARFGALLAGAGLIWSFTALGQSSHSLPYSIGRVSAWLVFPLVMYLILAYPAGRIAPGHDRRLYGGSVLLIAVLFIGSSLFVEAYPLQTPWASCSASCPPNAFLVLDSEPAVMEGVVRPLREALSILVLAAIAASLLGRIRGATPLRRRTYGPVLVMCVAWTTILMAYLLLRRADPGAPLVDVLGVAWALCIPGIAVAFLVGLLRRRLLAGELLRRLGAVLGERVDPGALRDELAAVLGDPELRVLVGDEVPAAGPGTTVVRDADGARLALVHDPLLDEDRDVVEAAGALALASLHVEQSRARIARAADLERSRIGQDLHDGAQQRLVTVRIRLALLEEQLQDDPEGGPAALRAIGDEVDLTLEELRSLAHGLYPAMLRDRGIADALRGVTLGSPLPVRFAVDGVGRHEPDVESAVYYTCLEAIQNALKHARGATEVRVALREDAAIQLEVSDDGAGFTPATERLDGGLAGMRDRIEAAGGRLRIESSPGAGTRVVGRIPLASRP